MLNVKKLLTNILSAMNNAGIPRITTASALTSVNFLSYSGYPIMRVEYSNGVQRQLVYNANGLTLQTRPSSSDSWTDVWHHDPTTVSQLNVALSNVSGIASATITQVGSYTIPAAGTYFVQFRGRWQSNTNGYRNLAISTSTTSLTALDDLWVNAAPALSDNTVMQVQGIITVTAATTIYFLVRHNSSSALNFDQPKYTVQQLA